MALNLALPTGHADGDPGHSSGHNATNTALNAAGAVVDTHTTTIDTHTTAIAGKQPQRSALQASQWSITESAPTATPTPAAFAPLSTAPSKPIAVDPANRHQQILGFGAAVTESTAFLLMRRMTRAQRFTLLHDLFGPGGFSMIRIGVGGTDFNTAQWWSLDETIDGKLTTAASANDTTIACSRPYPSGTELRIDQGGTSELVTVTGVPTGSASPYSVPVTALAGAHPINRLVSSTDRTLTNFTLDREKSLLIPLLQEILAINPALRIHASVWQVPSWMRSSQDFSNNSTFMADAKTVYATYLVDFVTGMAAAGIPIWSLSLQNEPWASGASFIVYTASQYADFIATYLGPAFDTALLTTRILAHDHHWAYSQNILDALDDASGGRKWIQHIGWHGYGGEAYEQTRKIRRNYPHVSQHFTEMRNLLSESWHTALGVMAGDCAIGALRNHAESVTLWNLALDETGQPSIYTTGRSGLIAIPSNGSGTVTYTGGYQVFRRLAALVQPGAVRCSSTTYAVGRNGNDLQSVAFVNPDESVVLLAYNPTSAPIAATVVDGRTGQGFPVTLAVDEVSLFVWGDTAVRRAADPTYTAPAATTKTPSIINATSTTIQNTNGDVRRFSASYTVPAGNDRCLIVSVQAGNGTWGVTTPITVTYGGVPMRLLDYADNQSLTASQRCISLFYLLAPATGAATVAVTLSKEAQANCRVLTLADVHQVDPFGVGQAAVSASATSVSPTVTTVATDLVLAACAARSNASITSSATILGQSAQGNSRGAVATAAGVAGTVSSSFTINSADSVSVVAVPVHGAS